MVNKQQGVLTMKSDEALWHPSEVCDALKISRRTLNRLASDGSLTPIHIRGSVRYRGHEVRRLMEQGTTLDPEWIAQSVEMGAPARDFQSADEDWVFARSSLGPACKRLAPWVPFIGKDDLALELAQLDERVKALDEALQPFKDVAAKLGWV